MSGNAAEVMVEVRKKKSEIDSCFKFVFEKSCWGQGEGLVGGTISPHSWIVTWPKQRQISSRATAKQVRISFTFFHVFVVF